MITPRFSLFQDEKTLTIEIRAPFCKLNDLDVSVEETEFIFCSSPYYLRLNLPGQIEENERSKSSYDVESGQFTFQYEKVHAEHFPDLDLITKFLCTKVNVEGEKLIEIISSEGIIDHIECTECKYGFALRGGYNFHLRDEFCEVFEIDPYKSDLQERKTMRLMNEKETFSQDHYLADLIDNEEINELISLKLNYSTPIKFTSDELDFIKDLKNVEYHLTNQQITYSHNGLIELLFAFCYDQRTTYFESTCESGWTISKLSATLSWFDGFTTLKEALICSFRRCLIFPLYRSFQLAVQILNDLKTILKLGEVYLIKSLIKIYHIFNGGGQRYILNNLYVKDYIVYLMKWDKDLWEKKLKEIDLLHIEKDELGLNLTQLEKSTENDELNVQMYSLALQDDSDDSNES